MSTEPKQFNDRPIKHKTIAAIQMATALNFYLCFNGFCDALSHCLLGSLLHWSSALVNSELKLNQPRRTHTHTHSTWEERLHCLVFLAFVAVLMATDSASYIFSYISDEKDYMRLLAQISTTIQFIHEAVAWRHFELVGVGGIWRGNQTLMRNIHKLHN